MVYLGINVSHGASAALMINGKIEIVFQEERITKIKNFNGYPKRSIDCCVAYAAERKLEKGFQDPLAAALWYFSQ